MSKIYRYKKIQPVGIQLEKGQLIEAIETKESKEEFFLPDKVEQLNTLKDRAKKLEIEIANIKLALG